jgi:alkanesulfonate monooxygenase SsuD/methylene tetrahydromethanopterin reductase-like flavin-dependent oxidoreductase (luciferase family)
MALNLQSMGFGITGTVSHDIVRELAPRVEAAGFRTLWINHGGSGDALASMQVAASVTTTLRLASGVVPVDRVHAEEIVTTVQARGLPLDRVVIGIGASARPSPLTTIREAATVLHDRLGATVYVGALGPKMRRVAVRETEGILLNWLTPHAARQAMADRARDLEGLPGRNAEVSLYIRVAMGSEARPVLEKEAARYAAIPSYAANFKRLGFEALDSAVYGESPQEIGQYLEPYIGIVDEAVVRAITPNDGLDEFLALVEAVAG